MSILKCNIYSVTFSYEIKPVSEAVMKHFLLILGIMAMATQIDASTKTELKYSEQTFKAKVGNVRLQSKLIEAGKSNDDIVSVKVTAVIFKKEIVIEDARKLIQKDLPAEVKFLANYQKANLTGSAEEIVAFWADNVREAKLKMVKKYFDLNRKAMGKSPELTVIGIIKHSKDSYSVLKRFSSKSITGVNLIKKDGKFFLVDETEHDLDLAIIEASFSSAK